ncbi:MAG: hypothetical protein NTY35_02430 [Planctomycetota bacterium]|nr:hypothetical protein [Planctomycetota bacterium]
MSNQQRSPVPSARRIGSTALLHVVALAGAAFASDTQVIIDGTFGAGLVSQKIVDTTPGASASFTSTTVGGGLPGAQRETSHTFADGAILVAHIDPVYTHETTLPLCKLDFSADLRHVTGPTVGGAVSYRLCLLQSGSYYSGPSIDVFDSFWATYVQTGLVASDFALVSGTGPSRPDFNCFDYIQFGFITANSATGGPVTKVSGIDNWTVTLNFAYASEVDGAFQPSDWTSTKLVDTTPLGNAMTSSQTLASGGFPGAYRETTHTWSNGAIVVGHLNAFSFHDPSVEPIYTIDFRSAVNHVTATTVGGAVGYRLALVQGSAWYWGPNVDAILNVWVGVAQDGLTSGDFDLLAGSGPPHPDFTNSGSLIQFGYATANSANGGPVTKILGVDSWLVRIKLAPPCSGTLGASGCFGNDPGSPCPCFPAVPPGASGRGCPNSIEPRGAQLLAFGTASLAADDVVLQAAGMPNSSCLYFQGAAFAPVVFGDGRRCASGSTIRLGTKVNICNASQYPAAPDPPISVQGMISAPGIRNYQVWYRNSAAFCTSATFNLTNSISINWAP